MFCAMVIEVARKTMAEMAENGRKWWKMDFRVFHVVAIEVEKRRSGKNGKNGGKWPKMAENGFPRENDRKWIFACLAPFPYY